VRLELREHRVERVGELGELVAASGEPDPCDSDPSAATRVASVMRPSGASIRPASSHPPTRPNTSRNAITIATVGANCRTTIRL
jgi:hypothetical protein